MQMQYSPPAAVNPMPTRQVRDRASMLLCFLFGQTESNIVLLLVSSILYSQKEN